MVPWLRPHSPATQAIVTLFAQYLVVAAFIFVIVSTLVAYAVIRYRAREEAAEPPPRGDSHRWEVVWTAIPLLIVAALFALTVRTMALVDARQDSTQPPDLTVTGHQWWWEASYSTPSGPAITATEIHIPAGRRLLARVEAADVIHDFWAPQLGRKIDAIPGRTAYIWLEADAPGTYQGTCSEFCGMEHAEMHFQVIAEPEGAFNAWLARQAAEPAPVTGLAAEGQRLFRERKCGACHAVSNADTRALSGPPLTHIASRNLLGGDRPNTPQNMTEWIAHPQTIKPGNHMPDQVLPQAELVALTAYMEALR